MLSNSCRLFFKKLSTIKKYSPKYVTICFPVVLFITSKWFPLASLSSFLNCMGKYSNSAENTTMSSITNTLGRCSLFYSYITYFLLLSNFSAFYSSSAIWSLGAHHRWEFTRQTTKDLCHILAVCSDCVVTFSLVFCHSLKKKYLIHYCVIFKF